MDLNDNTSISGLPKYLYRGQQDRTDELSYRALERNVPDKALAPNFSPRPVLSKYALFPMLDSRMPATVPITPNYDYSLATNFTPPVMKIGPVSGFINNVQDESILRNQIYPLSRSNEENVYIPSSQSDLYKVTIDASPSNQPHPELFTKQTFSQQTHPNMQNQPKIGMDRFNNNTRVQLRNIESK